MSGVLALGMLASLWSRFAALLTYVWFAMFRPQEWLWTNAMSDLRLSLVIALLLIVPSLLTGVFPNVTHPVSILSLTFVGTAVLAQFVTPWPELSWPWLDSFLRLVLVVLLSITILNTRRRVLWFMAVLAGSIGFHTAKAGLASTLGGGLRFSSGLGGAFVDNNGYALAAAMILPFLLCVFQNVDARRALERWTGWAFLAALPLTIFTVMATASRAGFLAVTTGVLMFLGLQRRRLMPLIVVVLAVVTLMPFAPMPEGYLDRLSTIRTYEEVDEESAVSRLHFWRVAIRMAASNPLGVGLRNFDRAYDDYDFLGGEYGTGRSVHSSHFQVLAELGYPGIVVWIALFMYAFVTALRIRAFGGTAGLSPDEARFYTTTGNAFVVSMASFLVGGAFIALAVNDITWFTFGLVGATDRLVSARKRELRPQLQPQRAPSDEVTVRRRATA